MARQLFEPPGHFGHTVDDALDAELPTDVEAVSLGHAICGSVPVTTASSCRCRGSARRLYSHVDGPLTPFILQSVTVRLSCSGVAREPVERLTGVSHLAGSAGAGHRAELRRVDTGPGRRLCHTLW